MILRTLPVPAPIEATLAVCADFHSVYRDMRLDDTLRLLEGAKPDFILCPGDLFSVCNESGEIKGCFNENGLGFLRRAAGIAPTYFSLGNHERALLPEHFPVIADTGAVILNNTSERRGEIVFGGYTSAYHGVSGKHVKPAPDPAFPARFGRERGYKILLSHHPEYWESCIRGSGIDLTVSGHAHGGQWRFFDRGVYAPGQGLFPKYTSGLYSDRNEKDGGREYLAVSRGMTNSQRFIPRFFNPCEILILKLSPEART